MEQLTPSDIAAMVAAGIVLALAIAILLVLWFRKRK
jgi:LPXTG-motif cell wall-anchored protein